MDVKKEIKSAEMKRLLGLIIVAVAIVFILVSLLLGIYSYASFQGLDWLKRIVGSIYSNTQMPVLSSVWKIAAEPDLSDVFRLKNLAFFGEVVIFLVGAVMVGTANKILKDIAEADHAATQERRKEQIKKEQEKRVEEKREKK